VRLHEFEAKQLFARQGIVVPRGTVTALPEEASDIAAAMDAVTVIKAQVLAGGRGKAGGIRTAATAADAERCTAEIMASSIRGLIPESVLIEEQLDIARELYLGITIDSAAGCPAVVVSGRGGVDIETVAAEDPKAIASGHVDPLNSLSLDQACELVAAIGIEEEQISPVADVLCRLYKLFTSCDALIAEINPLAVLTDGSLVAADAVVEIDDAALFKHPEWNPLERIADPRSRQAKQQGMTFVELPEGDIGLICSGAGLGMATVDLIADRAGEEGGRPANFLETGGGITRELMASAMRLVLSQPGLKAVLINVYGGINPIHEGAKGVAEVLAEEPSVPVVAKALGNHEEETWEILRQAGVEVVTDMATERVVEALFHRLSEEGK
jgi:succinyl-CoA synthetase beta subunit